MLNSIKKVIRIDSQCDKLLDCMVRVMYPTIYVCDSHFILKCWFSEIIFRNTDILYKYFLSCYRNIQTLQSWNNTISNLQLGIKNVIFNSKMWYIYMLKKVFNILISKFLTLYLILKTNTIKIYSSKNESPIFQSKHGNF